jgi:hypothetical protein
MALSRFPSILVGSFLKLFVGARAQLLVSLTQTRGAIMIGTRNSADHITGSDMLS